MPKPKPETPQLFSDVVKQLRGGHFDAEVGESLRVAIDEAAATQKKTAVTLKLSIEIVKDTDGDQVIISDQHDTHLPKAIRPTFLYNVPEAGRVQTAPPQLTLADDPAIREQMIKDAKKIDEDDAKSEAIDLDEKPAESTD